MTEVSIRELEQHASAVIATAVAGETIIITDGGRAVGQLTPIPAAKLQQLVASGAARPPRRPIGDLAAPKPGPPLSAEMATMRGSERY